MNLRKVIALCLFLALFAELAVANNLFIPNHYRNRRTQNQFSALGWSDRKEIGGHYSVEKSEYDFITNTLSDSETESKEFGPHIFYRHPSNLNLEAQFLIEDSETKYPNSTTLNRESKSGSASIGVGYELTALPMALGLSYSRENSKSSSNGFNTQSETKYETVSLGAGYRLENNLYLGAGLQFVDHTYDSNNIDDDKYYALALGVGKVFGDLENPEATVEGFINFYDEDGSQNKVFGLTGLYNVQAWQFYSTLVYLDSSASSGFDLWAVNAGFDWEISDFYIGPQAQHLAFDYGSNPSESKSNEISMEAGYRVDEAEVFIRYTPSETKLTNSTTLDSKTTSKTWDLGFSYHW